MKRIIPLLTLLLCLTCLGLTAQEQIVTTTPPILQRGSQGVILTYNAATDLGNKGLANLPQSTDVYAHIGLITSASSGTGDWKYTVTEWPGNGNQQAANTDKNRLTYVSPNTYTLNIGDIPTYFGISSNTETIKYIAVVFRTADGRKEGKTASGGDILIPVMADGFQMLFDCDYPKRVLSEPTTINFEVTTTNPSNISVAVNGTSIGSTTNATSYECSYNFKDQISYKVTATATYEGTTKEETLEFTYPDNSMEQDYPGGIPKMGAVKNADGSVTFCLAAPDKVSVMLVPSWDNYQFLDKNLMKYQDYQGNRYFWITVNGLKNDEWYPYYYIVDDTYKVADPYAHLVLDCYNDRFISNIAWKDRPKYPYDILSDVMLAVYRGDIDDYEFSDFTIPSHDNLVVYELLLRDFTGINGMAAGSGTAKRAMAKIPYLKELGVNVVELLPIMEFSGNNSWGYNTNFYMAPDKAYGSPTDFKDLIEEFHKNGIAVVLDIVLNQSDGLHPWYQMYPIDSNPFYNKTAPHAWSVLNDWSQDNPLVQQQWTDALKYWMEKYNVDGFRFDLVKGLGDNGSYGSGTDAYNQSRIDRMKRLHSVIKSVKPNGIHINELLGGAPEERALGEDGQLQWANINSASCQFTMGYETGDVNLMRFNPVTDSNRPWGSTVSYAESHDEQRMGFKNIMFGKNEVKDNESVSLKRLGTLAVQMLMTPGPKMIWQFGELGDSQNNKANADGSGDNNTSPKIVVWNYLDEPERVYLKDTYAAMINLRVLNPELFGRNATYTPKNLISKYTQPRTQLLTCGNKEIAVFINPALNGDDVEVALTTTVIRPSNHRLVFASPDFTPELTGEGNNVKVKVPANSFAVFVSQEVTGVDETLVPGVDVTAIAVGGNGRIDIIGDYKSAMVYDLSGRAIGGFEVPAGLYIVVIDGKAQKVLVR